MAVGSQYKVNQLAKDLSIKAKDLTDLMAAQGLDAKTQKALDNFELDVIWEALTKAHQIVGIEDYIDGVTGIPSLRKKAAETKPEAKAKAEKPAGQPQAKSEKPAPKAEEKKPEAKPEVKAEGKKPEAPKQEKKAEEKKPEQKPEEKKPQEKQNVARSAGERFESRMSAANEKSKQEKTEKKQERREEKKSGRTAIDMRASARPEGEREVVTVSPKAATRVVDTRGSGAVDLSKYDDNLDGIVPENIREERGGSQKVKKSPAAQNAEKDGGNNRQGQKNQNQGGKNEGRKDNRQNGKNDRNNNNNNNKGGKNGKKGGFVPTPPPAPAKKVPVKAEIPEEITVGEFAQRIKAPAGEVIKRLMLMGMMVTLNQTIDFDTAFLIADELGAEITKEVVVSIEDRLFEEEEDSPENLVERAPVVCVMGHVDHGKTSLLDAIRNTRVTAGEAGGITQHIGAYRVKINGKEITFLDTPGHEAFTAMRARGAQATDIAILVVAADDGIMPQTVEAINHAKAAGVQIIVAINKMDKLGANPDNIKTALTQYDLVPEEWGGDVMCIPVSALKHEGIDDLLEAILLIAEMQEYKANPNRRAKGIVIESKLDRGRGPVATVLIQNGTLRAGDIVIAGTAVGRVRAMTDHTGRTVKVAPPSMPVEITGLADVPQAGDEVNAVVDERMARELAEQRRAQAKEEEFKANARTNLNDLFAQIQEGVKELNVIVKADVGGSAEAVKQSLEKITNEEVRVRVIHAAAGGITEGDVMFAAASNAIIVGFNTRPDRTALDSAERQGVDIRTYRIIYDCNNEITAAMKGMLAPKFQEKLLGHIEVRQVIHVPNVGFIAGSYVQDGKITRKAQIRVVRDGMVV